MAVRAFTRTPGDGRTYHYVWTGLLNGDTGALVRSPGAADMTFQVFGTFGGGAIILQGSCETGDSQTNFFTLTDNGDNLISFVEAKGEAVAPMAAAIRPNVTSGDATTSLTAILYVRSTMR